MKLNPFKDVIFTNRTWMQLGVATLFFIFDIFLLSSTYKHIKLYIYYTKALQNIALNESGNAREKLENVIFSSLPYANLLAASLELENKSPNKALEILNKFNYKKCIDNRASGFSEILKGIAYTLIYYETKTPNIISQIDAHLNNATQVCPSCLEINVANSFVLLLQNKSIEAYRKLNEIISSTNAAIERNALYEAVKYMGEIDLSTYNKCDRAIDSFQKAVLYNPNDNLSLMKYLYCFVKTYKLKGEKDELENLRNVVIYKKISNIQATLSAEEKYYYSMILLEIGNLYKNSGSTMRAYDIYRDGLRQFFCNLDIITAYKESLEQEIAKQDLKPLEKEIKTKELQNLEENLSSKTAATPFEASEFLNCLAMKYYRVKNDINKAIELMTKAKAKSSNNAKVLGNLAILYINTDNKESAKEIIEESQKYGIRSSVLDKLGDILK